MRLLKINAGVTSLPTALIPLGDRELPQLCSNTRCLLVEEDVAASLQACSKNFH